MKNPILSTCWLVVSLILASIPSLTAQGSAAPSRYQAPGFFGGAGVAYPFSAVLQGGGYGKNGWGGGINLMGSVSSSENEPSDYDGGKGLFGEGEDHVDPDKFLMIGLTAIKLFPLDKGSAYASLELGPSVIWANQTDNFVPVPNPCATDPFTGITFCNPNYTYERVTRFGLGGFVRGAIHVRVFDQFGASLGVFSHLNPARTTLGVDMVATGGIFRKRNP